MLLLDHNIPRKVKEVLQRQGIQSRTAIEEGWDTLENGDLVAKAAEHQYEAILTRDRRLQKAAANAFKRFPKLTIVLIVIPQSDSQTYCAVFELEWKKSPIVLNPGVLIEWPSQSLNE